MSDQTNALALPVDTADNHNLSLALRGMTNTLWNAAEENIRAAIGPDWDNYSALEQRSMVSIEALRLTAGMDLTAILTRGEIVNQIEREGLTSVHPNGYQTLEQMARDQGISTSELSDTRTLCNIIFPYITNELGQSLAEIWTTIGKSAFREAVPTLKSLITGQDADHRSVREAVTRLLDEVAADMRANATEGMVLDIEDAGTQAAIRRAAVTRVMEAGASLPSRQFRRTLRPERTPPVTGVRVEMNNENVNSYFVLRVETADQLEMVNRLLGTHVDATVVNGANRSMATHRAALRELFGD